MESVLPTMALMQLDCVDDNAVTWLADTVMKAFAKMMSKFPPFCVANSKLNVNVNNCTEYNSSLRCFVLKAYHKANTVAI